MAAMLAMSDEARSDLFLSAAAYLFGPLLLGVVLRIVPLTRIPGLGDLVTVLLPLATTVLVPWLLIRYRRERLLDYGLGRPSPVVAQGLLVAAPIVAASLLVTFLLAEDTTGLPVVGLARGGTVVGFLQRLASWVGLALLAVYGAVKARDAFRSDPRYLRPAVVEIARVLAVIAAIASVLLALSSTVNGGPARVVAPLVILPLAVAAAVALTYRGLTPGQLTTRAILLTPVVLLALGPFALTLNAVSFVSGIWTAALLAGIGLVVAAFVEARRSAWGPLGLALAIAAFSGL